MGRSFPARLGARPPVMIPRILHTMWVGSPLPLHLAAMMGTWKTLHPDWEYRYWTNRNMIPLVNQELWDTAADITPQAPEQFQSDVARYEILHQFGGVWVDADFVCQKPLDPLMNAGPFAGRETRRWLNNALIGVPAEHPLMTELIVKLRTNVERHIKSQGNTVKSGPQYFTPIARRHRITEYPQRFFYPYAWNELDRGAEDFPDAYAVHTWNHQRHVQGKPLATV